jgi:hypothetical protein
MAKSVKKEIKYKAVCVKCGTFIPEGEGVLINNKNYCSSCGPAQTAEEAALAVKPVQQTPAPVKADSIENPKGILKVICYFASLIPIAGFILGAVFYPQKDPETKKFGRNCFIMMAIGLFFVLVFFVIMAAAGAALGGAVDKMSFGEGYF